MLPHVGVSDFCETKKAYFLGLENDFCETALWLVLLCTNGK